MSNLKPLHEQVAEKLIAQLQAGTSPFQKPWSDDGAPAFHIPLNPTTGKNYRGMNALWLAMQSYADPRWLTLRQANILGATVPKGTKATLITFFKHTDQKPVLDASGQKQKDEHGKTRYETVKLEKPVNQTAWVFNAEQLGNMPALAESVAKFEKPQTWSAVEKAESILAASGAKIRHGGNEAYYQPVKDFIQLPKQGQFASATQYYAVALHELGHWTGHESRLNRELMNQFGTQDYAREELRAEISSLMMGSELKIGHHFGQHAAYVENWVAVLKDDPFELYRASADAQKISDFVLGLEHKRELEQEVAPRPMLELLARGDEVAYNNTAYKITDVLKKSQVKIEDLGTGEKTKISIQDGLYKSLVQAKYHPELSAAQSIVRSPDHSAGIGKELASSVGMNVTEDLSQRTGVKR